MQVIRTARLVLEPLAATAAPAMFELLVEPRLYEFLDEPPPVSLEALRVRYGHLEMRRSPDGSEQWLNWVVRESDGEPVGTVQATLTTPSTSYVAFVFASRYWGRGYAFEATQAMIEHLVAAYGARRFLATVEAANDRSIRLLERLAFRAATATESAEHALTTTERLFLR